MHILIGGASYYNLVGNQMANGQMFDPVAMNAAMLHVQLGTKVTVESLSSPREDYYRDGDGSRTLRTSPRH